MKIILQLPAQFIFLHDKVDGPMQPNIQIFSKNPCLIFERYCVSTEMKFDLLVQECQV